jgi:hypothetical protein
MCGWLRAIDGEITYKETHWLRFGADYTATDPRQNIGGTLTITAELPPEAEQVVIKRNTPKTQEIDLHNGARLTAELIEKLGDKLTMISQESSDIFITGDFGNNLAQYLENLQSAIKHENITRETACSELGKRDEYILEMVNEILSGAAFTGLVTGVTPGENASIKTFTTIEYLNALLAKRRDEIDYPVGTGYKQGINDPDPIEKGLPGHWEPWTHRAEAYRLTSNALPGWGLYAAGANYAANAYVSWHLPGAGWELFKAKAAITNAATQLDPVKWDKWETGTIVERRHLQGWLDDDLALGATIAEGDYAGMKVCEVICLGGTFDSWEGGNRPTFVSGGVAGDAIRNIIGNPVQFIAYATQTLEGGGALAVVKSPADRSATATGDILQWRHFDFSADRVVPTAADNRVRTLSSRLWRRIA